MFFWNELTTRDFVAIDAAQTIAILPIAATEQYGPHLPVATDSAIAAGMLALLRRRLPADLPVLVLPVQEIGKSNEHILSPGTLTQSAEQLIEGWCAIGAGVRRAGLRKLVIVNSHGGNVPVMDIVARELRIREQMLVAPTQWNRFGLPPDLFDDRERRHGLHGGAVETSLMMHFRPDLVRRSELRNFVSIAAEMEERFTHLRPVAPHGIGWIIQDLNPDGALGDASKASAEAGEKVAEHQVKGFVALLRDVQRFDLSSLAGMNPGLAG